MNIVKINYKSILPSILIIILSVYCAIIIPYFGLLAPFFGGLISLILMFGKKQTFQLLKPMNRPFLIKLVYFFLLAFLIRLVLVSVAVIFDFGNISSIPSNGYVDNLTYINMFKKIVLMLLLLLSMIGEELVVASITLPVYYFLKKIKYGWGISIIIGSLVFSFIHLYAYDFNIWVCLTVGLSHIPMAQAWKSTNSLRGGMYIHILYNMISIVPTLFF
ncbi:CPBP family glutamic-type intramembrane protease [Leuconostoc citreum]|uniref:CPBP family glutamic-type intramembrane protease n=1 Tax=Leuconostoc citreum TaxID=33964 RepID=UPI0002F66AC7|nr:CPBP family glutamic-type intramembrane protease [Leuconostoc citreum]